jgi:ubiquinone/menaquinone biosynthesis C-methylase UbiE
MQEENKNKKDVPSNERKKFIDPKEIIQEAGIKEGDKIADFGCGPGYFSLPVASVVGEKGEVYALDVFPGALESLESQAKMKGIDNISIKRVNLEKAGGSKLGDGSVDWVILKHILFQNKDKKTIIDEANRVLRKDGKIIIMEWNKNLVMGPDEKLRVDPVEIGELIMDSGFIFEKKIDAGNYHYVIIAEKS